MKKFIVLIGNYGSGKTEIALNLAAASSNAGQKTLVVDLDKINDYFRMSDHVKLLEEKNVSLVSPTFVGQGVTQSCVSAAVASAFDGDWDLVIFDVGGDAAGAMSLGRYRQDFAAYPREQVEVWDIVNVYRPMSETPEKIIKLKEDMESFVRQKVTGFVNNSNLLSWSSSDNIRQGYEVLRETSIKSGIPVVLTTGRREYLDDFLKDGRDASYIGQALPLDTYMHRSWDDFTDGI